MVVRAPEPAVDSQRFARLAGLVLGLLLFAGLLLMPAPRGMGPPAQRMAAVAALMAALWIAETVPLAVTALLPLALFPLLGIMSTAAVAPNYANHWVFLLLGGFFIALAMQKWNLHKRLALGIISRVGVSARRLVLGFMVATAFLSMWISNSATTMMMVPIAMAIILEIEDVARGENAGALPRNVRNFATVLPLSVAYAANIGGVGTLVGTLPNAVFAGMVTKLFPGAPEITFTEWMLFGVPFVCAFLPVMWAMLVYVLHPVRGALVEGAAAIIDRERTALGPMRRGEIYTVVVCVVTALLWVTRRRIDMGAFAIPGWSDALGLGGLVNDATIAIGMGALLFCIPVDWRRGEYVMDWAFAARLPWGLLVLFGGGFALAAGFQESGLAEWVGYRLQVLQGLPTVVMVAVVALTITFLTEMTSNTATTTMVLPIMAVTAVAMGAHPFIMMLPAVVSASCAFMLPIATPPNAIAFATERITMRQMAGAGLVMNVIGAVFVTALVVAGGFHVFGATSTALPDWAVIAPTP